MKTIVKSVLILVPAIALVAGCRSERSNTTATGSAGPGVTYEQGSYNQQMPGNAVWNSDNANPGVRYQWQQ